MTNHTQLRRFACVALAATALVAVASTATAAGNGGGHIAPRPTPVGPTLTVPNAIGSKVTKTIHHPAMKVAKADGGSVDVPEATETLTLEAIPEPAAAKAARLKLQAQAPSPTSSLRSSLLGSVHPMAAGDPTGCRSGTASYGVPSSLTVMTARMSQVFCYSNGVITYWPAADCWHTGSYPTYSWEGCSTSQIYGEGWNQGRTSWHAGICDYYVPLWGACLHDVTVNRTYYGDKNGSWFRI